MSHSEELTRRLAALKQSAQEFLQMVSLIDGNFDGKLSELKTLEARALRIREENEASHRKAVEVLQKAVDDAEIVKKDARRIMDEAAAAALEARQDQERARAMIAEAQALNAQALQRQKEADTQWHILEARQKRIEEAMNFRG